MKMDNKAVYITRLLKKSGAVYEIIGGAEKDISISDKLSLQSQQGTSVFVVKDIEAFRKKLTTLPRMYSGLLTLELVEGSPPDISHGNVLFAD